MHRYIITIISCFIFSVSLGQTINDYRTTGSGNWTNVGIWEVFNGTNWVAATNYPGQVAGANDVSIIGDVTVTLNSNIPNSFNSLTIGDGNGTGDFLDIAGTSSLNTQRIDMLSDGFIRWTANVTFSLPAGAAVVVESGGGLLANGPCNGSKRLVIGTVRYAVCNGQAGADFSFEDVNNGGGSLSVTPDSNSPICVGETLTLFANLSGAGSSGASINWSGTGPGGYSFNSTQENPTETGLAAGNYTYTVTATSSDGSISNTNSTNVIVNDSPSAPISNGDQTACIGGAIPALTVTVNAGETADWYDVATGGTAIQTGSTSFTPTTAGSYFVEARNSTAGCISTTRTEITLTLRGCRVITNRKITYRVSGASSGGSGTPTGTLTTDMIVNFFADGQFGSGNPYQLQVQNNTATPFSYEIFVENVPYGSIPGLALGNHTVITTDNGDGTFNYLFTSTVQLGAFQTTSINGSGGAPSPPGSGTACGCISFYRL